MSRGGWKRYALVAVSAVVVLTAFAVLYGWLPWWIDGGRLRGLGSKDQTAALSSDRGDVLKMVAGAGALVALVYTARKHALDREGQVTDRYTKAITQLASERPSERIGGIYALERIMNDSVRDHSTVVAVLAAFLRQRAPVPALREEVDDGDDGERVTSALERADADVQAAFTVLARRPERNEAFALDLRHTALTGIELPAGARLAGANLAQADLAGADFSKADLHGADLHGATLTGADLSWANLTKADLAGVTLTGADLSWANLTKADLAQATLIKANLHGVNLIRADLRKAILIEADLHRATLGGANLQEATLTKTNLCKAILPVANLNRAKLDGADLCQATLTGASLDQANITGADLRETNGLIAWQLADAEIDESTMLDAALAEDPLVRRRIDARRTPPRSGNTPSSLPEVILPSRHASASPPGAASPRPLPGWWQELPAADSDLA